MSGEPRTIPLPKRFSKRSRFVRAVAAPGMAGAAVFVVAVLVAVLFAAVRMHETAEEVSRPLVDIEAAAAEGDGGAEGGEGAGAGANLDGNVGSGAEATLFVHVVGEVNAPGVVELAAGLRIADAIEAAGGATKAAALEGVNLAQELVDGQQILVPDAKTLEELSASGAGTAGAGGVTGAGGPGGVQAPAGTPGGPELVNLNSADAATLETLPRIGPAIAQRIIDWRSANGGFSSVDQLIEVTGIGAKTLEGLRERVTV